MAFHVGMKVVCVDAGAFRSEGVPTPLVLNRVYTVVGFDWADCLILAEQPGRSSLGWSASLGYDPIRFRPVVERETDISALKALLDTKRITLPDLVDDELSTGPVKKFAETVGLLVAAYAICVGVSFAQFWSMA